MSKVIFFTSNVSQSDIPWNSNLEENDRGRKDIDSSHVKVSIAMG